MDWLVGVVVLVGTILVAWLGLIMVLWLHRPSRELVGPALRLIPELIRLVRSILAEPATQRSVRVALVCLLLYLLSPIDLVPDFLPGIGAADDVIIAGVVLRWAAHRVGLTGLRTHWSGSEAGFALLCRLSGLDPT